MGEFVEYFGYVGLFAVMIALLWYAMNAAEVEVPPAPRGDRKTDLP